MFFFPLVEPPLAALQPALGAHARLARQSWRSCAASSCAAASSLSRRGLCLGQQRGGLLVGLAGSRLAPPLAEYGATSEREARYHDADNKEYNRFHL